MEEAAVGGETPRGTEDDEIEASDEDGAPKDESNEEEVVKGGKLSRITR